jgi:hypothetical protein
VRNARRGAQLRDRAYPAAVAQRFEQMAGTSALQAAGRIIRGIERNEPRILIGRDARIMDLIQRLRPAGYWAWMARAARLTLG